VLVVASTQTELTLANALQESDLIIWNDKLLWQLVNRLC